MPATELSRAFQTALGVLLTNSEVAARFVAGEIGAAQLHESLTAADIEGLGQLVSVHPDRVVTLAGMLTGRRRQRVVNSLRATVNLLGGRFEDVWSEYLRGPAPRGLGSTPAEAGAFGNWLLRRLEPGSLSFEVLRYELCRADIAQRMRSNPIGASGSRSAITEGRSRLCLSRYCLSRYARLERFDSAVDEVMLRFRRTGEIRAQPHSGPVHLVFHPLVGRVTSVGVTKVSAAMGSMLARSTTGSSLHGLLSLIPAQLHTPLRVALDKLLAIHVLDLMG